MFTHMTLLRWTAIFYTLHTFTLLHFLLRDQASLRVAAATGMYPIFPKGDVLEEDMYSRTFLTIQYTRAPMHGKMFAQCTRVMTTTLVSTTKGCFLGVERVPRTFSLSDRYGEVFQICFYDCLLHTSVDGFGALF